MSEPLLLTITLHSDATFASGDGVAGLLDRDVEHDALGLPYLRGRTLKGLLSEEADNILYSLRHLLPEQAVSVWQQARWRLFGAPGSIRQDNGIIHFGPAQLPDNVRATIQASLKDTTRHLTPQDVLYSLTAVRRQTAMDDTGLPREGSLRSMRVILRQTSFAANLLCLEPLSDIEKGLLAAAILAFRYAGTGRNRGRGHLAADLFEVGQSVLHRWYERFQREAGL